METTRLRYATASSFSAQDQPVSRQLYDLLKAHTNWIWGAGVEVIDNESGKPHPIHLNYKDDLAARFVFGQKRRPRVLTFRDVERHLEGSRKAYFTGSKSAAEVFGYIDCDCHEPWQDDLDDAVALLKQFMPKLYCSSSPRGANGYPLLRRTNNRFLASARAVNRALDQLEMSLRKSFLFQGIKTTVEVKGHIQHNDGRSYYCGKLAKVPNWRGMSLDDLTALKNTSRLTIPIINWFAHQIDAVTKISDEEVWEYYRDLRKHKDQPPVLEADDKAQGVIAPVSVPTERRRVEPPVAVRPSVERNAEWGQIRGGDSFARGFRVCLELARRKRRVPSTEEVLGYLHEHGLYTGKWEENEQKRAGRIAYNLAYINRTFDAGKLGKSFSVDLNEYRRWVERHYPAGIGTAPAEEVNIFLAITKFCLIVDPNEDGSLPYERFKSIWERLHKCGTVQRQFRWNRWATIRDRLVADGVIQISGSIGWDRALEWDIGPAFPNHHRLVADAATPSTLVDSASAPGEEKREEGRKSYLTLSRQQMTSSFHRMAQLACEVVENTWTAFWQRE